MSVLVVLHSITKLWLCGLTIPDIEFEEMRIKVDHQLQRTSQMEYVI